MKSIPMASTIDRRALVTYTIDPDIAARHIPAPFRPRLYGGGAVGGICLIRLTRLRPVGFPRRAGVTAESVAHRFAVEWDGSGGVETGVFVPRRDTSSQLAAVLGGRAFPGPMRHGRFLVRESDEWIDVAYESDDGSVAIGLSAAVARDLPCGSVFGSVDAASEFFRRDTRGFSPTRTRGRCDCVELDSGSWMVSPLAVDAVRSSWFDDPERFPSGTITFDSALLMRGIPAVWRPREERLVSQAAIQRR